MTTNFFGNDHSISFEEAKKMTTKFRAEKDAIMKDEHKGKHLIPHCESFDRTPFDQLLQREDCKGIRIYYGMKENDKRVHAIIVGIDSEGRDIVTSVDNVARDGTDPIIIENGLPCPNNCPESSGLNQP
jgi:hypothetical protein